MPNLPDIENVMIAGPSGEGAMLENLRGGNLGSSLFHAERSAS